MRKKPRTLGIIGVGAFGEFMLKHLTPYFDVSVFDNARDLTDIDQAYNVRVASFDDVCACDILVPSVPVKHLEETIKKIAPKAHPGQIIVEVCSVKCGPVQIMLKNLPEAVDIISLHPLFGPQSGKFGIHGFNIALCDVRSKHTQCVEAFLSEKLGLNVHRTTPEQHDSEMAYVQGLTHMIGKVFTSMKVPDIKLTTRTFTLLNDMVELIKYDSDELFRTIQRDNPYVDDTKADFFKAVKALEQKINT